MTVELVDGSLHRLKTLSRRSRASDSSASARTAARTAGGADRAARRRPRDPARRTRERAGARLRRWLQPPTDSRRSSVATELERVPGGRRGELEECAAAVRLGVGVLGALLVPRDLEQAPPSRGGRGRRRGRRACAASRRATRPRRARDAPSAGRGTSRGVLRASAIRPSAASSTRSATSSLVEVVRRDEAEPDGGGADALLEVSGAEGEPVAEELERVVVARGVVPLRLRPSPGG